MQVDFHHGVIYVLARLAGFTLEEANIIAYSSQYVDDTTANRIIRFSNGALYKPICSAHKIYDYKNFDQLADHLVWVPFHFLPGNALLPAGQGKDIEFIKRIICRPNSYIAKDMVNECIRCKEKENSLHRLGISLHVYADTWSHQGFAGVQSEVNRVGYIDDKENSRNLFRKAGDFFGDVFDEQRSRFVDGVLPLGHGPVLSYPDRPYLVWEYLDYQGRVIKRENPKIFMEAVNNIFIIMKKFLQDITEEEVIGLNYQEEELIKGLIVEIDDTNGQIRHQKWMEKIREGFFAFGKDNVRYDPDGPESWEAKAFGLNRIGSLGQFEYWEGFAESDWKKFHDALRDHRYYLLRVLLPRYGLCIA